ncbi:MAG: ATP-binding protein [Acetobacteraceae bacterium]|nr:ATP-binding protein [Acetobacteraceae bacterium]
MLQTVRQACTPHASVLRADPEPDIEDLAQVVRAAEADADRFFSRNHVTSGMKQLFELGIARLDGRSEQGVYTLTQAMGGGKTHLMVAFGLIAKSPELRQRVLDGTGIRVPNSFGAARVVAFSGRNNPDHYIWGEIASQLGKAEAFARFWNPGPKAPDEKDWIGLIGDQPTLIMLDELPPWIDYASTITVGQGTLANTATYALGTLFSAVLKLPRTMVILSNLSAAYTNASKMLAQALNNIRQEANRGVKEIIPVALNTTEIFDILRKRLFEKLPGAREVDEVAAAYAKSMDEAVRSRIVAMTPEQYAEQIRRCYPFHPRLRDLVALFRNNERFRQTRGLLRLVGRVVRDVWAEKRPDNVHLIGVQHMDLNDPDMRNEVLPLSDLQEAVAKDIADGGQAHAEIINREVGSDAEPRWPMCCLRRHSCAVLMRRRG